MLRPVCVFLLALVLGAPALAGEPGRYSIEQLTAVDRFGGLSFSPDNQTIAFTSRRTGIANINTMPVSGGDMVPLTDSQTETIALIGYFPDDERLLFSSDRGGDERAHIYVREVDGTIRDLTPGEGHVARFVDWAHDGQSFFVMMNARDRRFFDLHEITTGSYVRERIFVNDGAYQIRAVSPDRSLIAMSRIADNANTITYLYHTGSGVLEAITPLDQRVISEPQAFSPDGRYLLYTSDEGGEFRSLRQLDLASGQSRIVFDAGWDVLGASYSRDGRYVTVTVNEDARGRPYLLDAGSFEPVPLGDIDPAYSASLTLSGDARLALLSLSNGQTPHTVKLIELETGERRVLLDGLPDDVARDDLVAGEVIRFSSYDGLDVPGVLYIPRDARPGNEMPAVVHVHGGPGGESRIGYSPLTQYLVNHGYVVFEINNRGSSGSGRTFFHLDDRAHGDADLGDVVAARAMLSATGYVHPDRIAVQGASYGGFMTLAALAFEPEAFAAGVNIYGVSNWVRLLRSTPEWWEDLRRLLATEMGDVETDEEYLRSISPVYHAENIVRPLMVLQGANDPRVLQIESDDIVERVRANGVPVEYIVFPDEGHSFRKTANQIIAYRAIREFLDIHVRHAGGEERAP
ncbi:prolyl oligopeptidase family serine peptidase [Glycocaulis sp.]|uniref:S9 family peptidase n=1 Tax=Glycocaulis sp. TaxID=1969725 RepID=UPI003D1DD79F